MDRNTYLCRRRELYQKNKEKISAQNRERYLRKKEEYLFARKEWKKNNKDKIVETTKVYNQKSKDRVKKWRENNKDYQNFKQRERRKNRTQEQKKKDAEYAKKYRFRHRDKIKEYQKSISTIIKENKKRYYVRKYRSDIKFKLLHNLRSRAKNAFKGIGKDSTTLKLLGCTMSFFKNYIENKFNEGMSWDGVLNGSIHIDHIIPCAMFDLTIPEEQKKCFHYSNLQPLWAEDNLKKGYKCLVKLNQEL